MIIERVEVENFRALKSIDVNCEDLTVLLGKNGTGKSTLLYALDVFYNVSYQASEYDYFAKDTDAEIKIRVTFGDLRPDEVAEFQSQLDAETLVVTKVINSGGARYYGASRQVPEFAGIRSLSAAPKRAAFNELVESGKFEGISRVTSGPKADEQMDTFEAAHPELLEVFQAEQQFLGPKNIGGGKLDKFTRFVLIPAVRDAASEADRKGAIFQLIDLIVTRSINNRADVIALNEDLDRRIREVYNRDNLSELAELAGMITERLMQYAPGAALDLAFDEITPPKIPIPSTVARLVEDNFKCPISYTGHGLQRALVFALLQQLSVVEYQEKKREEEEEEENQPILPGLILAIEEPELYLHPARSRYLSNVLNDLVRMPEDEGDPRTQVLIATHSPYFLDIERFERIRLARKSTVPDYDVLQSIYSKFERVSAIKRIAEISGIDEGRLSHEGFITRATPIMTALVSEGFFADVVVIVEGVGDAAILMAMQEVLGKNWDGHGIVVVPAGGKNNIDRPVVIFRGLEIPTYFIFDGDDKHKGKKRDEAKTTKSNALLLRLAEAPVVNFPESQVNDTWAVFSNDIESELKAVDESAYHTITAEVSDAVDHGEPSKLLKNPQCASMFIRRWYEAGLRAPILEEIIDRISALLPQRSIVGNSEANEENQNG